MYEYPSVISCVREFIYKEKEMSNIKSIFSRATIRGVADYLLFGNGPDEDDRSYIVAQLSRQKSKIFIMN